MMEDGFSDDEKLSYLLDCLKDPSAAVIERESLSNGDTFKTVEGILYGKYDQPREVFLQASLRRG